MPSFSGSSTAQLEQAVGTWTLCRPTMAGLEVGNLGKRVHGTIPITSAQFAVAEDGTVGDVRAVLDIASIDTGHAKRDKDLRKPVLLDLAKHPQLTFRGTQVVPLETGFTIEGLLTAKGTTRTITLPVTVDEKSDGTVAIRLTGQLDRRHYGIRAPRFMIGALVDFEIEARFARRGSDSDAVRA